MKQPSDVNQQGKFVVDSLTGTPNEEPKSEPEEKRKSLLSPERRYEIARQAALVRYWTGGVRITRADLYGSNILSQIQCRGFPRCRESMASDRGRPAPRNRISLLHGRKLVLEVVRPARQTWRDHARQSGRFRPGGPFCEVRNPLFENGLRPELAPRGFSTGRWGNP